MSDPAASLKCKPHLWLMKKLGACKAPSEKAHKERRAAVMYASVQLMAGSGWK